MKSDGSTLIASARQVSCTHNAYAFFIFIWLFHHIRIRRCFFFCHRVAASFRTSSLLCRMSIKQKSIAICAYRSIQIVNDFRKIINAHGSCVPLNLCLFCIVHNRTRLCFFSHHLSSSLFFVVQIFCSIGKTHACNV